MSCIGSLNPYTVAMVIMMVPSIAVLLTGYTTSEWEILGDTYENYTTSGLWERCTTNIGVSTACWHIPTSQYTDRDYHIRIWTSLGLLFAVGSFTLTTITFIVHHKYRWRILGPGVVLLLAGSVFISVGLAIYSAQSNELHQWSRFGFSVFCVGASVFGFFVAIILALCDLCNGKRDPGIVDYTSLGPDYGTGKATQPAKPDIQDPDHSTDTPTGPGSIDQPEDSEVPDSDKPGVSQPHDTEQPDDNVRQPK